MAISRQSIIVNTCNKCNETINEGDDFVDASSYHVTLHKSCASGMSALELAKTLGLDFQVKTYHEADYQNSTATTTTVSTV